MQLNPELRTRQVEVSPIASTNANRGKSSFGNLLQAATITSKNSNHLTCDQQSKQNVGIPTDRCQQDGAKDMTQGDNQKRNADGNQLCKQSKSNMNGREHRRPDARNDSQISAIPHVDMPSTNSVCAQSVAGMGIPKREMKKLVRVLQHSSVGNKKSVFMTLDLGEAGEVRLDVRIKGKEVFISAYSDNKKAGAALAFAVAELKARLAKCDLKLGSLDVNIGRMSSHPKSDDKDGSRVVVVATS